MEEKYEYRNTKFETPPPLSPANSQQLTADSRSGGDGWGKKEEPPGCSGEPSNRLVNSSCIAS
jgi:hypothetical protein